MYSVVSAPLLTWITHAFIISYNKKQKEEEEVEEIL